MSAVTQLYSARLPSLEQGSRGAEMPLSDESSSALNSAEARVLHSSLVQLNREAQRNSSAIERIDESLHTLTRLEQQAQFIVEQMKAGVLQAKDHDDRLRAIERDMPGLKELRKIVIWGVLASLGMIGTALLKLVVFDVPRIPPAGSIVIEEKSHTR